MKLFSVVGLFSFFATAAFSQTPSTLQNLKGTYVFTQQGSVQSNQSITGLGLMTFDGNGNVSCIETLQIPGANVVSNCSGKYYIGTDGSASIEINYDSNFITNPAADSDVQIATARFKVYITGSGKLLKGIRTENGVFVLANFEKN